MAVAGDNEVVTEGSKAAPALVPLCKRAVAGQVQEGSGAETEVQAWTHVCCIHVVVVL